MEGNLFFLLFRYRIIATLMEWMTFQNSPHSEICALYRTVAGNGEIRILRAGRTKPTTMLEMRRNRYLIKSNYQQKSLLKQPRNIVSDLFKHIPLSLLFCPLPVYPDGPFFQTHSAEAIVF